MVFLLCDSIFHIPLFPSIQICKTWDKKIVQILLPIDSVAGDLVNPDIHERVGGQLFGSTTQFRNKLHSYTIYDSFCSNNPIIATFYWTKMVLLMFFP